MIPSRACCIAVLLLSLPMTVRADRLQLSNGDEIEGELLEISANEVKFRHPILGTFTVPRHQIHAVELGKDRGGKRIMDDIRNEAIDARDQLKELMDELGPGGEALRGYYGILDGFIEKTDPNAPRSIPGIAPLTPKPIPPQ